MLIQDQLIALTRELETLCGDDSGEATERRSVVREQIRTIGRTAAFFGGYEGMAKLHDACESRTGSTNEIGSVLNRTWDDIGGWWA